MPSHRHLPSLLGSVCAALAVGTMWRCVASPGLCVLPKGLALYLHEDKQQLVLQPAQACSSAGAAACSAVRAAPYTVCCTAARGVCVRHVSQWALFVAG